MALVVETGAVVAGADSYVTLAEYTAYALALGWTAEADDSVAEVRLRRGFQFINQGFEYRGERVSYTQVGAFPRYHGASLGYDSGTIPQVVKDAQCEMAYLIQGGADPFATVDATVKREKIGPLEVEYQGGLASPRFKAVTSMLRDFLLHGESNRRIVRA